MKDLSIYIHIPFCKEKCFYCDFLSFTDKEEQYGRYLNALLREIVEFSNENPNKYIIKSIFIGGGTPSILPIGHIQKIMETIFEKFNIQDNSEITIEVNPGAVSKNLIKNFKEININRISLGLQAWQDEILKSLGRIHSNKQFLENFFNFREMGFDNINIDLIFSLPNQTIKQWEETLFNVYNLRPEHISCYSLIIEEGTVFYKLNKENKLNLLTDEQDRKMYYRTCEILSSSGYKQYEISNFSLENKQCYHNIVYWTRKEYVGFGLGASSFLNQKRIVNTRNFKDYLNFKNDKIVEHLSVKDCYSEFIFLGLRMNCGIKKSDFKKNFGVSIYDIYLKQIEKLILQGLILDDGDNIKLTKKGIDISNTVFIEFL